jgi:hypothetical protein
MEYDRRPWFPISEAPKGKCVSGTLITCTGCGKQVFVRSREWFQQHRWWEQIGWGKVDHQQRHHLKGDLYCAECYPTARVDIDPLLEWI